MILSDVAIRRPVFTTMVIAAIVVFGLVSYRGLGIDLNPRVEFPLITIISVLPGADPETMETTVTDPIEEAVSTISQIKHLRSTSADSVSQVVIEFELTKDVDVAYQEVTARIGTVRSDLPDDLEEPIVEKFDIDSQPVLAVLVSGEMPVRDLTRLADRVVKQRLQSVKDVGQVKMVGGRDREIWVRLDRDLLAGHGLAVGDVEQALRTEHVEIPGGRLESGPEEFVVKTRAEFTSAEQMEAMVVAWRRGAPVRLSDVGRVEDGVEEERSLSRLNEEKAVSLLVRRQSGTNTVAVAEAVKAAVARLGEELAPAGVRLAIAQDQSQFIEHSVGEMKFHLGFGGALAILIVFLFLRNFRSTLISGLVIPTSVIGTFMAMAALGFTQNQMTLLALSLSIGLLIDDAIVVQENIVRHIEEGQSPRDAAHFATSEIALAVFATTMSIVAVFLPVAFTKGMVGRFLFQFGITVAFAVLLSMFVSFTLDPMLSSRILRKPRHGPVFRLFERGFLAIERAYEGLLGVSLRHRFVVILLAVAAFAGGIAAAGATRSEFLPNDDQSEFLVKVKAPLGSSLGVTDGLLGRARDLLRSEPFVDYTFEQVGADELRKVNEGQLYVKLVPIAEREVTQEQAIIRARTRIAEMAASDPAIPPGAKFRVEVVPRASGTGGRWADVQVEIRGPDLAVIGDACDRVTEKLRASKGYRDLDTTFETGKPEVNVYVDRGRAADLGVSPLAVATTIRSLVGGTDVGKFRAEGDRYDIRVRLEAPFRERTADLPDLYVRSATGALVTLGSVATPREESGPVQIDRYGRTRQITILANLDRSEKVLGEAIAEIDGIIAGLDLPAGYSHGYAGTSGMMEESFRNLLFALALAVIVIYMVLAAQFESFVHPFTIMMSLPLSVVGALGLLAATGRTMSIFTMIGIIMLMGLVTKNAILLVDFTNTLRRRDGMTKDDALRRAGPVRLRPILMTTFAMIFGMLPIALSTGVGAGSRAPMAIAVIGGLTTSTLLTLVVVPVVYSLLDDLSGLLLGRRRRGAVTPEGSGSA